MLQRFSRLPWLWVILVTALAVRVGAASVVQKRVDRSGSLCLIAGDAEGYWMLARHIAHGEDFAIYDPPRYIERMPGFPLLLAAGMKLLGENAPAMRLLLAVIGTLACGLVFCLGRELVDRTTGLIACLLAAVSPTFIVFSVLLLSETLFAVTLLASLWALARLVRCSRSDRNTRPSDATEQLPHFGVATAWLAIVAGVLCGLATLVRPTWILIGPAFVLILVFRTRADARRLVESGLLLAGLAAVLAPWTIRNGLVTGHYIPTTLWMGPSLYDGLSPQATGDSNMQFIETDGLYARHGVPDFEFLADAHYRRAALDFARRNPTRAIELGCHKLWRFVNPFPNAEQFGHWAVWWGVGLFETPVLLLAALGAWRWRTATGKWCATAGPMILAAGPVLYFALVHTVFVGSIRYRLPAEYALLILTAVGVRWLAERLVRAAP
jgi:4-amino-4-deoxy-L-arabinose transferase-like glycosyltransferase